MGTFIESIEILLLVAAIVSMVARKLKLPYTVGLTVSGLLLALIPNLPHLELTQELLFKAFLPPLIFEAAFQIKWKSLKADLWLVSTLATVGVLVSAGIVALGSHYLLGWGWASSGLIGILISATDPVAVIALFKDLGVKGRLQLLTESESLFNDGTAAVLFAVAIAATSTGHASGISVAERFVFTTFGGILCGGVIGFVALLSMGRTEDHLVEITFTSLAAYGSFLLAEHFHLSGVLATLTAGIVVGNVTSWGSITERGHETIEVFWEYVAFAVNSLIFLLIGISLGSLPLWQEWKAAGLVIGLVLLGRAAAVYGCCALFHRSKSNVDAKLQHILFWGGLRGALALALALGLPSDFEGRSAILSVAFAVVAFSVIVQGLTIGPLMSRLGVKTRPAPSGST